MPGVSPDAHSPLILGIAGLPGSGKSCLITSVLGHGRSILDDINNDWADGIARARAALGAAQPLIVSDIMFCHVGWRQRLADELGQAVDWTYFANDPVQCARNCTRRIAAGDGSRTLTHELRMIEILSKIYRPAGEVRPVYRPPAG